MDAQLLTARIQDAIRLRNTTDMFKSVGFLSESECDFVSSLAELKEEKYVLWGGYEDAQRKFFIALPQWCENAQQTAVIESITFTYRKCDKLTHRDFLGAFMALGITREAIGDILCSEGRTVAFVSESISEYICSQIEKVGRVGVQICLGHTQPLPVTYELKEFSDTVASVRLDCVVAALLCTSREKAKEVVCDKKVTVNGVIVDKITFECGSDDVISVRGSGKFILKECSSHTKKGRIIIKYLKYV
ncbi:MAG: YlmH/Sll1252 family protein [Acutalibacteraceae bacterium]|nr:YlmH/Sll1252 family protein [Acutalibacteraceae bacterium]